MISHLLLKKTKSLSPSVSLQEDSNGFEFLIIEHEKLSAAFTLFGGHLIHFQKGQQTPLIWLSKTAKFDGKKAIRGGVPICWPWFGAADPRLGEDLPAHGFARTSKWSVGEISESSEGVELALILRDNAQTLALWPHQFELTLKATLNAQLTLALISENRGDHPFTYRGALHTYLNISEPEAVNISGLNTQFSNSLKQGALESGDSTLLIDQPIDAIYEKSREKILLKDEQYQQTITMANAGNDSEVLWTPWIKGAQAFVDMPDNGYQTMFCIESAITRQPGEQVKVGEKHILSTLIHY